MDLCDNQDFLDLREKAINIPNINDFDKTQIENCCTVDCIVGVLNNYDNLLAAETQKNEIDEIIQELNELADRISQELAENESEFIDR